MPHNGTEFRSLLYDCFQSAVVEPFTRRNIVYFGIGPAILSSHQN